MRNRAIASKLVKFSNKFVASLKQFRSEIMFGVTDRLQGVYANLDPDSDDDADEREKVQMIHDQFKEVQDSIARLLGTLEHINAEVED